MILIQDTMGFQQGDKWQIIKNGQVMFLGGFKSLLRYCVLELGFNVVDFERAVSGIVYNGHNTLEFDDRYRLISTSNQPVVKGYPKR